MPAGQAQRHRNQPVPVQPTGGALPVSARRGVGGDVQDPVDRTGPVPGPGGSGQRRWRRRPEERELRPGTGSGQGRIQGVHGRMGTPEHTVLGHIHGVGDRRGRPAVAVLVPAPTEPPSPQRQSAERAGDRLHQREQRLGRGRQQDRTRRALVLVKPSTEFNFVFLTLPIQYYKKL